MSTEPKTAPEVIHELAAYYRKELTAFETKAYLRMLSKYDFDVILEAAFKYVDNHTFLNVDTLRTTVEETKERNYQAAMRSRPRLTDSEPTNSDKAFGSFVCEAVPAWMRSGFIKKQREAGTFRGYDHSLFAYLAEKNMDPDMIDRFAGTYEFDPRRKQ